MRPVICTAAIGMILLAAAGLTRGDSQDEIIFPHGLHQEQDIECETCHAGVVESTSALTTHRPDMDVCADCHDVDDETLCAECHTSADAAEALVLSPTPGWNFSHAAHTGASMECAVCHGDVAVAAPRVPEKDLCRSCHETAEAFLDCRFCHAEDEALLPSDHTVGWENAHGIHARLDQSRCELCHTQTGCQDCHAGDNAAPRSHDIDFAFGHALQARGHEIECMTCHLDPQFCSACHQVERVLPRNHSRADWVRMPDGGRHAEDGLFELESCVACHDAGSEAPLCASCHGG